MIVMAAFHSCRNVPGAVVPIARGNGRCEIYFCHLLLKSNSFY